MQTDDKFENPTSKRLLPGTTREQIEKRAYEIFMRRGGEPGHELDDWLLAENELQAQTERCQEQGAQPGACE